MNELKNCIVIFDKNVGKYVDKSKEIAYINIDKENRKYNIRFASGKVYNYNISNVRWLSNSDTLDVSSWLIYFNNERMSNVIEILRFGEGDFNDWIKIVFKNGEISSYPLKNLKFVKNKRNEKNVKNFLEYLKEAAGVVSDASQDEKDFLQSEIEKINVSEESVLYKFIAKEPIIERKVDDKLIFPFSANAAQIKAVKNALNYDISCIQGPPGTGKTQTILNILTNLLVKEMNVAVVAGNNEATRNVHEKIEKEGFKGIDAYLGNKDNIKQFFSQNRELPEFGEIDDCDKYSGSMKSLYEKVQKIYEYRLKCAELQHLINEYTVEKNISDEIYNQKEHKIADSLLHYNKRSDKILKLAAYLEILSQKHKLRLIHKAKLFFSYGLKSKDVSENLCDSIDYLQNLYYSVKLRELTREYDKVKIFLKLNDSEDVLDLFRKKSMNKFKREMRNYYSKFSDYSVSPQDRFYKFSKISKRYPIIYSTTHSLHYCCGDYLFDYVIIDESSQVDLISAVIAMSCAKRIVFVGDQKQLSHVVKTNNLQPLEDLFERYSLPKYFNYASYSILKCISEMYGTELPCVLLNEHYRCDPQIIEFCNKCFYKGELVIQTKHEERNGIEWISERSHTAEGMINLTQAETIIHKILPKIQAEDVGIVAPYRKQVELLGSKVNDSNVLVDTIHKFQGKERDVMILSTVSDKVKFYEEEEKIDFLNNANLINVAVSRAKNKLYVVASKDIAKQEGSLLNDLYRYVAYYCGQEKVWESNVYSVFDLMYDDYSPVLEEMKKRLLRISEYDSENIIATVIDDICKSEEFGIISFKHNYPLRKIIRSENLKIKEDQLFVENPNSHCDFIIFNKLDKSIILVIEVDGKQHNELVQKQRDERKDRLLRLNNISILRLKTTESDCENKIKSALALAISSNTSD